MIATPQLKLAQYHRCEIDGWEVRSWAWETDESSIEDQDALQQLRNLDDCLAPGHNETVEALLYRVIPEAARRPIGELLVQDAVDRLSAGVLSSSDFVAIFVDTCNNEVIEGPGRCAPWIMRLYDENNGYGFLDLEQMRSEELLSYIDGLRKGSQ